MWIWWHEILNIDQVLMKRRKKFVLYYGIILWVSTYQYYWCVCLYTLCRSSLKNYF